jgi:hypothetical protein
MVLKAAAAYLALLLVQAAVTDQPLIQPRVMAARVVLVVVRPIQEQVGLAIPQAQALRKAAREAMGLEIAHLIMAAAVVAVHQP